MDPKWLRLTGDLLQLAADAFSDNGCNDWSWPADWSAAERRAMAAAMVAQNEHTTVATLTPAQMEDVEDLVNNGPPDWWVMEFLAQQFQGD